MGMPGPGGVTDPPGRRVQRPKAPDCRTEREMGHGRRARPPTSWQATAVVSWMARDIVIGIFFIFMKYKF